MKSIQNTQKAMYVCNKTFSYSLYSPAGYADLTYHK